jgi:hypothetical protein
MVLHIPRTNAPDDAKQFTMDIRNADPCVKYHIGADYLISWPGSSELLNITDATGLIRPVFYTKKKSTITASPHISRGVGGSIRPTYEGSETFDNLWDEAVKQYAASQAPVTGSTLEFLCGRSDVGLATAASYLDFAEGLGLQRADIERYYEQLANAVGANPANNDDAASNAS